MGLLGWDISAIYLSFKRTIEHIYKHTFTQTHTNIHVSFTDR